MLRFVGQAAHAGSTPLPLRRDAFLAAAQTAVECREAARRALARRHARRLHDGFVSVQPNIPTAIAGACEMSLDLRALDAAALGTPASRDADRRGPLRRRQPGGHRVAAVVADRAARCSTPRSSRCARTPSAKKPARRPRLPSGPVHDATEMAGLMPAVMLFAASPNGLSHCREEDTPDDILETGHPGVRAVGGKNYRKSEV